MVDDTDPQSAPSDPPASDPSTPVSRQHSDSTSASAIAPQYEDRLIIVAQGIQYRNIDMRANFTDALKKKYLIPEYLQDKLGDGVKVDSDDTVTYTSDVQHVNFTITFVTTRTAYKKALETPGVHVVYNGHARYGRGPCFGDAGPPPVPQHTKDGHDHTQCNQWGDGINDDTGIWRIGFPFLGIPVSEIITHGYFADPVYGDAPKPPAQDCHPDVRGHYSQVNQIAFKDLSKDPKVLAALSDLISVTGDPDETFWAYPDYEDGKQENFIVLKAGWQGTVTPNFELGATNLQCKVFCHFGCSSYIHNYPVLRKLRGWTRTDDDRFAFWTTNVSDTAIDARWMHRLLSYPKDNAFQSWKASLDYAVQKTNADLRNLNRKYSVI